MNFPALANRYILQEPISKTIINNHKSKKALTNAQIVVKIKLIRPEL